MTEVSIIGVDLAKQVFQLHGATAMPPGGRPPHRLYMLRKEGEDHASPFPSRSYPVGPVTGMPRAA